MRKVLLFLSFFCGMMINLNAQIQTCCFFDDFWSEWTPHESLKVKGDFDNFIVYEDSAGPWEYFLRVKINDFSVTPKKQRKKDLKEKSKRANMTSVWLKQSHHIAVLVKGDLLNVWQVWRQRL